MRGVPVAVVAWALAASASAQDFSPVPVRNYRPYSTLFLRFVPGRPPLGLGETEWSLGALAANQVNYVPNRTFRPVAVEDIELDRLDVRYARGIGKGWELAFEAPIEDLGPGFMDPIISWYHHTFLRLHTIRDKVAFGGHQVFSPAGGPFAGGFGVGDTSLFASKSLGGASFVTAGLKLPTGDPDALLGSGGGDAGIAGQTGWRLGRHFGLTVNGGAVVQGTAARLKHTRAIVLQGGWTLAYAQNSRDVWLVQANYEQSPLIEGIESLDKVEPSTTFAYRRALSERQSLTAYFTEDINPLNSNFPSGANTGPDFVIGLVWNWRL
ncbi:MAG TPA: DUF3187 family protein [Fimbriimonadaceae bacterium]|nr:DUF3187 family protein [Fimbriimonadaceae bacterium]